MRNPCRAALRLGARRLLKRAIVLGALGLVLFLSASPALLYLWAISKVQGRPTPPTSTADSRQAEFSRCRLGETGAPEIVPDNPWKWGGRFALAAWSNTPRTPPVGTFAAQEIAKDFRSNQSTGHRDWHVTTAALTIWVTRHWTANDALAWAEQHETPDMRRLTIRCSARGSFGEGRWVKS